MPPQPSEIIPHWAPISEQVTGVQPHFFEMPPPPQVAGSWHMPQWIVPPQPSGAAPQLAPKSSHVMGRQPWPPSGNPPPVPTVEPSGVGEGLRKPSKS
jgi:hypothetical protein